MKGIYRFEEAGVYLTTPGRPMVYLGTLGHSVGPWGESTGEFRLCETTQPLTELAAMYGVVPYVAVPGRGYVPLAKGL